MLSRLPSLKRAHGRIQAREELERAVHLGQLKDDPHRLLQAADPRNRLVELYKLRDPLYREVATHVIESDRDAVIRFVRWLDQEPLT